MVYSVEPAWHGWAPGRKKGEGRDRMNAGQEGGTQSHCEVSDFLQ